MAAGLEKICPYKLGKILKKYLNFIYSTFAGYKLEALLKLKAFTVIFE